MINFSFRQTHSIKTILTESKGVFVIMTATGLDDIHSTFRLTKGDLFFSKIFTIPELTQVHIQYNF